VSFLTLRDIEDNALPSLLAYATIPCQSPSYDSEWETNGQLLRAAQHLAEWAKQRNIAGKVVDLIQIPGRTPLLLIEAPATNSNDATTILYGHLDKQPPLGNWSEGLDPYQPARSGNKIFARGVADDGYSVFSALLAIEEMDKRAIPRGRCIVLIESSEESGSPDLEAYLDHLEPRLGNVKLLICLDSGALTYDRLWMTTSLRGVLNATIKVAVLEQGQHSGTASGVVPSSFRIIRQLLDRVEDASTGSILLEELSVEIPQRHIDAAEAIAHEFGDVTAAEMPWVSGVRALGSSAAERILNRTWRPTLSITGASGLPDVAVAGNVLRPFTSLSISLRLPPTVEGHIAEKALRDALTTNVPFNAEITFSGHAATGWVSPELEPWLAKAIDEASKNAFGREPGFYGEGGTIPFLTQLGNRFPGVQIVATGVLGPHSNAHGIDEMLDLDYMAKVTNAVITLIAAVPNE
jgi:acetylornithine deacetylase/succinyl-diaminopimelate desuccinylase-like protein